MGIDYVLHSATKYLGGHNDLLAGAIIGSQEKLADIRKLRGIMGAICAPHCHLPVATRLEDVRAADAAPERKRSTGGGVS